MQYSSHVAEWNPLGSLESALGFGEHARHSCLYLDDPLPDGLDLVALPVALHRAVPRRQVQFRAGRYCARLAMEALDNRLIGQDVERAPDGAPMWPLGLTGSITHTDDFAAAAVAWTTSILSIGIDTERVMDDQQATNLGDVIATPEELRHGIAAGFSAREALTLAFSAKESVFKCLHPLVGRMFDFHDVRLVGVDGTVRLFRVDLARTLGPEFLAGTALEGRFALDSHRIHTGVWLDVSGTWRDEHRMTAHRAR